MMRSLYSGVAGLKTHQTKMDVIGNNIANVNTTSFKSQSITFSDLMYQTTQTASGATETKGGVNARQIGLGAKSGAINTAIESQGATQTTNNPFDIMITGKAFFVVNDGSKQMYTRDGSFYVDGAGNLAMQSNGYLVQGWNAVEDPETGEITINKNGELSSLQIMSAENSTYSPASTTSALISGNIDDNDTNVTSDNGKTITLEFYDNKGYLYTGKFNIKDTGYDNLFSVELTDVIDSNGTKLTAAQMEGISFGNRQDSKEYMPTLEGYSIEVDNSDPTSSVAMGSILQQSGHEAFTGVPASGQDSITPLSDIPNFLEQVYEITNTKRYANIKSYEIDNDALNVTFEYTDFSNKIENAEFSSFVMDNTDAYYFDPSTNFGYLAPSEDGGKLSSLNTTMLDVIFKVNASNPDDKVKAMVSDVANYVYEYDSEGTLKIIASKVPENTEEKTSASKLKTKYDSYFEDIDFDGDGVKYDKISDFVAALDSAYDRGAYYEYNDASGVLEIYGGKSDISHNVPENITITASDSPKLYTALMSKATDTYDFDDADLTGAALDGYNKILNTIGITGPITSQTYKYDPESKKFTLTITGADAEDTTQTKTATYSFSSTGQITGTSLGDLFNTFADNSMTVDYSDLDSNSKAQLQSLITKDGATLNNSTYVNFTIRQLTGTTGLTATAYFDTSVLDASTKIGEFKRVEREFDPSGDYECEVPDVVFRDKATKKTGYVLFDEDPEGFTLDDIPDDILYTMYKTTKAEIKTNHAGESDKYPDDFSGPNYPDEIFNVKFVAGGKMTVTHEQTDQNLISTNYLADVKEDGTVTYTTASDIVIYPSDSPETKSFPLEGLISDLLATADNNTKALLQTVFGVTDADARAYGSEGYYVIDPEQGVRLYTSKNDALKANKTIQLEFDPATGNIISANGNMTDKKVNLKFNQSVDGLEAFGFQETPGVDREAGTIEVDFSTVTNYNTNGSSTIKAVKGDKKSLNTGRAVGEMNGVSVSTDGQIYATYSNGQTKLLGQIASAEFANASGLSKEGDNLYTQTLNSGEATIQDITTDGGYMNTGVLEMSNVDLSSQFTEMITTQRGFQANSRIITVSDTLLEELTNLKR